jgi:uncharacterized DUF497 family protein
MTFTFPQLLLLLIHSENRPNTNVKMEFEWDEEKAEANLKKHEVDFEEAATVFDDLFYVDFYDPQHSAEEHRFLIIGESNKQRILIVSYTERDDKIRIISARELTPQEQKNYEQGTFE